MLPGFNTDFKYRGETYHVQTEDNGVANPFVVTLLYFKGAILASKKTSYRELLGQSDQAKLLAELMKTQHKTIMRDLLAGTFDGTIGPAALAVAAATLPDARPPVAAAAIAPDVAAAAAVAPAEPASTPPVAAAPPPLESLPLDAAIARYLREFAAAAARGEAAAYH